MEFDLAATLEVLERTPAVADRFLRGISRGWHTADEGPETWSPIDVVGHLIHDEDTDWVPRARILLEYGEARAFERFEGWHLERLLDRFAELRFA